MPSYETEGPITATIHVEVGVARISATDRTDTVVEIRPRTAGKRTTSAPPRTPGSSSATAR